MGRGRQRCRGEEVSGRERGGVGWRGRLSCRRFRRPHLPSFIPIPEAAEQTDGSLMRARPPRGCRQSGCGEIQQAGESLGKQDRPGRRHPSPAVGTPLEDSTGDCRGNGGGSLRSQDAPRRPERARAGAGVIEAAPVPPTRDRPPRAGAPSGPVEDEATDAGRRCDSVWANQSHPCERGPPRD